MEGISACSHRLPVVWHYLCKSSTRLQQLRRHYTSPRRPIGWSAASSPPRQLPANLARARHSSQFDLIFGGIFAGVGLFVGLIFTLIGLTTGEWLFVAIALPIQLLFGGVGFGVLFFGRRRGGRLLKALAEGTATLGTITEIYVNDTIQVNGRSPWKVIYTFTANGVPQDAMDRPGTPIRRWQPARQSMWSIFLEILAKTVCIRHWHEFSTVSEAHGFWDGVGNLQLSG